MEGFPIQDTYRRLAQRTLTLQNRMVFEHSELFDHWLLRQQFSTMGLQYEAESEPFDTNLVNAPGRSRVENLVAWEPPGGARSKCVKLLLRGPYQSLTK